MFLECLNIGFFFPSFIFLEVFQKTFGKVNETICNLFWFFFFLLGVIQSHLKAIEWSH